MIAPFRLVSVVSFLAFACLPIEFGAADEIEVFAEVAKFLPDDAILSDYFGHSVSLDGDTLAVGAYWANSESGTSTGAVYLYERDVAGKWTFVQKIVPFDGFKNDRFGHSVSLDGDRLLVGSHLADEAAVDSGSVYLYERDAEGWNFAVKISAYGQRQHFFGESVSLDGDRMAIGATGPFDASGLAYVFERDGSGIWQRAARLQGDGVEAEEFGFSVSLDGDRLAVGAYRDEGRDGAVYVFDRDLAGNWSPAAKLRAQGPVVALGYSVSLDGDRVAAGALYDDENGHSAGAAYVFERGAGETWFQAAKILAPDGEGYDYFGVSVSLDDDILAVGAYEDADNGDNSGSTSLFERSEDGTWSRVDKFVALDGMVWDHFGASVSLDGDSLAIGAEGAEDFVGAAYLFSTVLVAPALHVEGSCPGEVRFTVSGLTPRSGFELYASEGQGSSSLAEGSCVGTVLDLEDPTLVRQGNTNFEAESRFTRTVDASKCGSFLQLLDERTCLTSDLARLPQE